MIKLKPIKLGKIFTDVSRNIVRELGAMVKFNVETTGDRYPRLKPNKKNRQTRMYDKGHFSRNGFTFELATNDNIVESRIFLSKKDHYSGHSFEQIGRWNMGENETIRESMGRWMYLFPQNQKEFENLKSYQSGQKKILQEIEKQLEENLELTIKKTIKI